MRRDYVVGMIVGTVVANAIWLLPIAESGGSDPDPAPRLVRHRVAEGIECVTYGPELACHWQSGGDVYDGAQR